MTDQLLSTLRRRFSGWNEGKDETLAEAFFDSSFQRWVVTSYAAVLEILRARNSGGSAKGLRRCPVAGAPDLEAILARGEYLFSLGRKFQNSPDTERLRKALMRHLGANEMHVMAARLEESADLLLSSALERGSLEVMGDLARPLVNGSLLGMVGVPEQHWAHLAKLGWAVSFLFGLGVTEKERTAGAFAFVEICRIVRDSMSDTTRPRTPAMAGWVEAVDLGTWSLDEAATQIAMLIIAGRTTTITAIGSLVHRLVLCPAAWEAARSGRLAIDALIEECLRLGSPRTMVSKTLSQDATIGGAEIPAGERILLMLGRANRDPAVFDNPLEFNPWRCQKRHLAFGAGSRQCPGMHLARAQMRAALLALLKYLPQLEMAAPPTWTEARNKDMVIDRLEIRVRQAHA